MVRKIQESYKNISNINISLENELPVHFSLVTIMDSDFSQY